MLSTAIEAKVDEYLAQREHLGRIPKRKLITGVGQTEIERLRVRSNRPAGERELCTSKILPPYFRKTKGVDELLPWL